MVTTWKTKVNTVNIIDYEIKTPQLAKVIISFTGNPSAEEMKAALAKKLEYAAVPVSSSFKQIKEGVAIGFVRANKAIRSVSKKDVEARYRVMSSNILMDNEDRTLWDVKEGASGKYLARHGQEDLTALVQASVQRRPDLPALRHITIAKAAPSEMVAFVDAEGDMDYGFAIGTNDEKVKVLSFNRRIPVSIEYDRVVSIQPVAVPKELKAEVLAAMTAAEKKEAIEYYQKLYGYSPEYVRMITQQINEGTVM
jgi:hypothetical protein